MEKAIVQVMCCNTSLDLGSTIKIQLSFAVVFRVWIHPYCDKTVKDVQPMIHIEYYMEDMILLLDAKLPDQVVYTAYVWAHWILYSILKVHISFPY